MNAETDADLGNDANLGPVDNEGRPIEPPVLSMEGLTEDQQRAALIVRNAGLYLRRADEGGTPIGAAAGASGGIVGPAHAEGSSLGTSGMTVMPRGWSLDGNIESSDAVTIGCQVKGKIEMACSSRLEVLPGAAVIGSIQGDDVVIRGLVEGEINASGGRVSIEEGATIRGKVCYTSIRMSGGEHQMELVHIPRQTAANGL